ncbi:methyltransferase domain-containing protein [Rhodocaloribacter litoris]|uniref:class I SAM-dependent methyltransferase n=1 Tax=Rhodocaloribacter litoris TaxID=2558931 RepID=UPI00142270CD|nr:class I SAM-dependent methyltransferase [Rhodocaloribacter litoris]QXD15526.1 methyltransferase domain-containing protein [Rhodocaloribacter litoris]
METPVAERLPLETTGLRPTYRFDLRTGPPDVFVDASETDWRHLTWKDVGRPYLVENYSKRRRAWEQEQGREMPVPVQWKFFNKHFHQLFMTDLDEAPAEARQRLQRHLAGLNLHGAAEVLKELARMKIWNKVHRVEDAVWDPRGKRALFEGLDVKRPRILFLGAAEGYEAMQLLALYPGGHAVLVDYDDFCRTDRYGHFPEAYPFLGRNPATGQWDVYHKEDFHIDYVVEDIRNLKYGREFDIVLSVGLIEHFPDEHKPLVFDFHRRFLKPGGYAIMTTPRRQLRSRLFYLAMGELMNFGYRELMDVRQMGLYAYENGFEILRAGHIKAHNGIIARAR